jgi:hypothetical protein
MPLDCADIELKLQSFKSRINAEISCLIALREDIDMLYRNVRRTNTLSMTKCMKCTLVDGCEFSRFPNGCANFIEKS